ncbi:aspartate aminotransferase family protein [Wenxinia saemankumensis]|uniref:Taurine-pyruvate aminotransferase n=1 Tax=Wenxinia saemankumensis TaxID=1447782 RepID=A0A1M6E977_9RHOB|nr:aminotransferase class III-fold pyridoxal phosphate-dependent enzyme [Wenxinia saemankumensis]SHI82057.1 taurine-pyruvate aminotransferase [Wenxinia saemankumensis]
MDTLRQNDPAEIIAADKAHVWHHMMQHKHLETTDPQIIVEGKGLRVWDITGKEHIDAVAGGVWTVNVGYGRTEIADAVRDALVTMNYFAGSKGSIAGARFSQRLVEKMPGLARVYLANSGSEANEKAFKMVRQIAHKHHGGRKHKILYRNRDYHGTTVACLSAGGQHERNAQYGPMAPGFVEVPHCLEYRAADQGAPTENYGEWAADQIEQVILREGPDSVGALCLEPITAGGGIIVPPTGYWDKVQDICARHNVLLHIDEVVCGMGRTGTWFGYQQFGVKPDIVTMAKGVASGYAAISCCVTTEDVFQQFTDASDPMALFRDISTFGGCISGPVAALENMDILEREGLLKNSEEMGAWFKGQLEGLMDKHEVAGDVRGMGLFAGVELVSDRETKQPADEAKVQQVVAHCLKNGVIIGATNRSVPGYNNTLVFAPALIATKDDLGRVVEAVDAALGDVFA